MRKASASIKHFLDSHSFVQNLINLLNIVFKVMNLLLELFNASFILMGRVYECLFLFLELSKHYVKSRLFLLKLIKHFQRFPSCLHWLAQLIGCKSHEHSIEKDKLNEVFYALLHCCTARNFLQIKRLFFNPRLVNLFLRKSFDFVF